jgi:hypothetical protein
MGHSFRSCLTVGVATITAATIAFVPSVKEPAPVAARPQVVHVVAPAITLAAGVQPLAAASVTDILALIAQHYAIPPSAGKPFPTPQFPPVVAPTSIGSSIIWVYNAVEPWARYVADVAAYAVGWIPYVGWLAPQIPIFYNFGERIARSITYNIAFWLDGDISFGQGLVNVGVDTVNAFIQLGIDQWNFWLWPLPPLPPIFPGTAVAATAELTTTAAVTEDATSDAQKLQKKDREALGDVIGDEAVDSEASTVAADEGQEPAVKEAKEPKTTPTAVAAQGEVRGAQADETTAKKVPNSNGHKTGEEGQATGATSGASASATTNDDTGAKRDKKDATGKK